MTVAAGVQHAHPAIRRALLLRAALGTPLSDHPARTVLATAAIALGVALGFAVYLINASALAEFELSARQLSGEADVVVRTPRGGFDESLYPAIARMAGVQSVNPAIEVDAALVGRAGSLRILGLDPLRATEIQPGLLGSGADLTTVLTDADAILLSAAAADWLGVAQDGRLAVQVGTRVVTLRVAGVLPAGAYRQRIGLMDVAAAQWRFERLGQLNRLDIRLARGVQRDGFLRRLEAALPPGVRADTPQDDSERAGELTRAYRLNLDMLALIALFTGAFLVFSSQALSLLRRRVRLAILRALGVTRAQLLRRLLLEGALLGAIGSLAGIALGYLGARYAVDAVGADLGAGYFRDIAAEVAVTPLEALVFFLLGLAFALAGTAWPALEAARRPPALALRAGDEENALRRVPHPAWALAAVGAGLALTRAPAVGGIPAAGYLAIALVLIGLVLAMPWLTVLCLRVLPHPRGAPAAIAVARVRATPRQSAISIAAIVTSVSLMAAMLIMVSSFRGSLETWLERMLPADLYLGAAREGETGYFSPDEQVLIAQTPGVARVEFLRSVRVVLRRDAPPVTLLARPVDNDNAAQRLPLIGPQRAVTAEGPPPVWVSEIAAALHGLSPGDRLEIPLGERPVAFVVAGVWRDYARQNGAVVVNRTIYEALSGDRLANEAALWVAPGVVPGEVQRVLRARLPDAARLEFSTPGELRRRSLALFDRTFAITYALEAVAVFIGLFGISVSFSAQALARRSEFGMLRHLGLQRGQIAGMLGGEGALIAGIGALFGLAAGWIIGLILIHVVNRQSFHWSMELHMPWLALAALTLVMVVSAGLTAAWSARAAMSGDVVQAVREDW